MLRSLAPRVQAPARRRDAPAAGGHAGVSRGRGALAPARAAASQLVRFPSDYEEMGQQVQAALLVRHFPQGLRCTTNFAR